MIFSAIKKLPFTITFLSLFLLMGILTNSHVEPLSEEIIAKLGFSAQDLFSWEWWRILTAVFTTVGGVVFWRGLFITGIILGTAEWKVGSIRTFVVFFASHILTLWLASGLILVLHSADHPVGTLLAFSRDVGPSAGYFGTLGFLFVAFFPKMWRLFAGIVLWGILWIVLFRALQANDTLDISAALAHVIAFPLGWILYSLPKCMRSCFL